MPNWPPELRQYASLPSSAPLCLELPAGYLCSTAMYCELRSRTFMAAPDSDVQPWKACCTGAATARPPVHGRFLRECPDLGDVVAVRVAVDAAALPGGTAACFAAAEAARPRRADAVLLMQRHAPSMAAAGSRTRPASRHPSGPCQNGPLPHGAPDGWAETRPSAAAARNWSGPGRFRLPRSQRFERGDFDAVGEVTEVVDGLGHPTGVGVPGLRAGYLELDEIYASMRGVAASSPRAGISK